MTDDDLVAWLDTNVSPAARFSDTRLGNERAKLAAYYEGSEPKPLHGGNSTYVSRDVYEGVESMKAVLLETFTGNRRPVRFAPTGPEDVMEADEATAFTDYTIFRRNPGFKVLHDAIHDCLMNRVGITQVYWDPKEEWVEEEQTVPNVDALGELAQKMRASGDAYRKAEHEALPDGSVKVTYECLKKLSQIRIEAVPPEEFIISPRAISKDTASIVGRRKRQTKSDLMMAGFDKDVIEELSEDDNVWLDTDPELTQRHQATDDTAFLNQADSRKTVVVYTIYAKLDMDGEGLEHLWEIVYAGQRVLRKSRVSRNPFIIGNVLPVPHRFWGNSFANNMVPTQNARTLLERAILDHAAVTTNPRYTVVRGGLTNPKELLENRLGGIVNITRDGAVQALPQNPLNPFIFQTIQLLQADKEEATGISKMSQGLNKDVISKQNSAEMVGRIMDTSQQRQKVIARNWAYGYMQDLWLAVYQLAIENETDQHIIEIAGSYTKVDPSTWAERKNVEVEFYVGYGEAEREQQKWLGVDQYLSAQVDLKAQYPAAQRYNVLKKTLDAMGVRDIQNYLLPPDKAVPMQPDPVQVELQKVPLREIAVKEHLAQMNTGKVQSEVERKQAETTLKADREAHKVRQTDDKASLAEREFTHKMVMDAAELAIVQHAPKVNAIASV